jgi:hypothetical protein
LFFNNYKTLAVQRVNNGPISSAMDFFYQIAT